MAFLERRRLGRTAVEVTRFGFGGAPMGERFVPVDNATADAVLPGKGYGVTHSAGARQQGRAPPSGSAPRDAAMGARPTPACQELFRLPPTILAQVPAGT